MGHGPTWELHPGSLADWNNGSFLPLMLASGAIGKDTVSVRFLPTWQCCSGKPMESLSLLDQTHQQGLCVSSQDVRGGRASGLALGQSAS